MRSLGCSRKSDTSSLVRYMVRPSQTMKPTAPLRSNFSVFATRPAVAYLFLVRRMKPSPSFDAAEQQLESASAGRVIVLGVPSRTLEIDSM
jgi:hypothetical protein